MAANSVATSRDLGPADFSLSVTTVSGGAGVELVELWSELGAGVDLLLTVLSTFTSCFVFGSIILIGFLFLALLSVLLAWETGGGCETGAGGAWWND